MKRFVSMSLILVMCFVMFAFTGCPSPVTGWTLPDGLTYDGSEVTITFYHTMGENLRSVLDNYIEEFNKIYPNIKVEHSQEGGYDDVRDLIKTEITTGNQPNIAYCYPDHVALYNLAGVVVTLDQFINNADMGLTQAQIDDFIDGYYEEGRSFGDDQMYTLPLSKSTEVLYYNKTFFDEHGFTVPTTWEEMEELCRQIKALDEKCIPLGYDSESNWFITMCEQYKSPYTSATGDRYLFNNDTNKSFVETFARWHYEGLVTTQEIYGAYTSGLFINYKNTKGEPYSVMSIGSSAGATHQRPEKVNGAYPFEVGIATIPQVDANNAKVISQGPSLCIFQSDNDQEVIASWLFVKFLTTSVEFQAEFSMVSGYVPVLESVSDNKVYAEFLASADGGDNVAALSAKVCLEQKNAYYVSPAFNGSSEARDQVGALLQNCLVGYKAAYESGGEAAVKSMLEQNFAEAITRCENNS